MMAPTLPSACDKLGAPTLEIVIEISEKRFEELVSESIDLIPEDLFALIDNVVFLIEDQGEHLDILGLYDGIPLTERESYGIGELPDRIFIYRRAICTICDTDEDVVHEVITTVVHEVAHHFGIDDDRLHELGWG
jgi:predicted Zn-dependent protease with MMP-like domain